jgi:acetylornithine/succinyldiaminopimelate/putrescine aminotransferase
MRVAATAAAAPPASAPTADKTAKIVAQEAEYVLQTYGRPADVVFVRGQGSKLYDMNGREYLDMAAGELADWSVNNRRGRQHYEAEFVNRVVRKW